MYWDAGEAIASQHDVKETLAAYDPGYTQETARQVSDISDMGIVEAGG